MKNSVISSGSPTIIRGTSIRRSRTIMKGSTLTRGWSSYTASRPGKTEPRRVMPGTRSRWDWERDMEQTARMVPPYVELMNEAAKAVPVSMAIDASRHGMARQAYDDMVRDGSFDSLDRTDMVDAFTDAIISTARESRMQAAYEPITNIKYGDLNGGTVKIEVNSSKRDKLRGVALLTAYLGLLAAPLIPYITRVRRLLP